MAVGVVSPAAITEADVQHAVRTKRQLTRVVICVGLRDLKHNLRTLDRPRVPVHLHRPCLDSTEVSSGSRDHAMGVQLTSPCPKVRSKRHPEQSLLRASQHLQRQNRAEVSSIRHREQPCKAFLL